MSPSEPSQKKETIYTFLDRVGGVMAGPVKNNFYAVHLPFFDGEFIVEEVRGDTTVYSSTSEEFMFEQRELHPNNFLRDHPVNRINKSHPK